MILGYLSLFICPVPTPGRVVMGMTTILTLVALYSGVRQAVPKVSYISYLDIWMVACLFFTSFCILEFVIVIWLIRLGKEDLAEVIERYSRYLFPVVFIVFCLIYMVVIVSLFE